MKIFLDTNVLLHYFLADEPPKHADCVKLIGAIQSATLTPYTSNIVLLEYQYVITKTYGQTKSSVLEDFADILSLRGLVLIDKTDTRKALSYYHKFHLKFGDCFIATQVSTSITLCTYDADFAKIPSLKIATPADILNAITHQ